MGNNFQRFKNIAKKIGKQIAKTIIHTTAPIIAIVLIAVIVVSGLTYEATRQDGSYVEGDMSNAPFATTKFTADVTINADGKITTALTAQELWDEMIKNNNRVDEYLEGPEELLKLMNAEIITNYPDTRTDPTEEINWEELNENVDSNEVQGIIKFKRADENGNTSIISYVDSETFYEWIEEYNISGNEDLKNKILSHFTMEENKTFSNNFSSEDITAEMSEAIIQAAYSTASRGPGLCQAWVRQVYANAGLGNIGYATAYEAFKANVVSTDMNNIPIGAAVYGTGTSYAGHVGIYIGNGKVRDSITKNGAGYINESTIEQWLSWQTNTIDGKTGWLGWGWQSGAKSQTVTENIQQSQKDITSDNNQNVSASSKKYTVVVGNWEERYEEKIAEGEEDPEEDYISGNTVYSMTTQNIDYQNIVTGYTMPFDYLWALIVTGREKDFPMELADLVYKSEIEITIHDNYRKVTDIDTYNYTRKTKVHTHDIKATIKYGKSSSTLDSNSPDVNTWKEGETDEILKQYTTKHTVITITNTLDISLTKANVWIVDYSKEYIYETPEEVIENPVIQDLDKIEYPAQADNTDNKDPCNIAQNFGEEQLQSYSSYAYKTVSTTCTSDYYYGFEGTVTNENKIETKKYTSSPAQVKEKVDSKSTEDNFVTLFVKTENYEFKNNILSAPEWLFDILKSSEKTVEMVDLTKYLLYQATKRSYGVDNFDFSIFEPENFLGISTGSEGGLSLTTTMFTKEEFKQALQAYYDKTGNQNFYNNFLLKVDELYDVSISNNINPELVVIAAKSEGNYGEAGGSYNYWGIGVPNGAASGTSYSSFTEGITGFANIIHSYETGSCAAMIMQRYQERKEAGCDPLGYGLPGTLSGMQSLYSYLGKHVYGGPGTGGYYYMDPDRAGVTTIYKTHEEFLQKCKDSGLPEHAEGTETTVWEQGQFTAFQVEFKLKTWDEIFGDFGDRSEIAK